MLAVIVNRRSRAARRDPGVIDRFRAQVGGLGVVLAPDSPELLTAALRDAQRQGCTQVALFGGDGTGHRVMTAVHEAWPHDALPEVMWLHGGTMNTVSRSMGQRGRPTEQLEAWLSELRGGPRLDRTRRWPLHVTADDADGAPLPAEVGFLFGVGIVARFIEAYEQGGEPSPLKAAATLVKAVASAFTGGSFAEQFFRGLPADVTGDGVPWPRRSWKILTVGAVDQIGLGFRPTPGVLTHPGCLHAFASASSPVAFARDLVPLFRGHKARDPGAHDQICHRLEISADEALVYNLDGDLFTVGRRVVVKTRAPVRFVLAPGAVQPANALG